MSTILLIFLLLLLLGGVGAALKGLWLFVVILVVLALVGSVSGGRGWFR